MQALESTVNRPWTTRRGEKRRRLQKIKPMMHGPFLPTAEIVPSLEALIVSGDRVVIEGDNQKQADFLSRSLAGVDPGKIHNLHLIISSISRPEHLTLFEFGIAEKVDFAFAGPQSLRLAQLLEDGKLTIGAIHTYVELYARLFVDLVPNVVLVCAEQADKDGNIYTGPNTEDTPVIVEAAAFHDGIVIVQVNEIVDELPRVDIPASWIDVIVEADQPFAVEPLFTRDPRQIDELQILIGMLVIRRDLRAPSGPLPQSRDRLRHRRDRVAAPDLRRVSGAARKNLRVLGSQPASDIDPGDRERMGQGSSFLRQRGGNGSIRRRASGHFLHRSRRKPALEPRPLPACRLIRG